MDFDFILSFRLIAVGLSVIEELVDTISNIRTARGRPESREHSTMNNNNWLFQLISILAVDVDECSLLTES